MFGHVAAELAPYAEGLLSAREASAVAAHLAKCARCRHGLARVRTGLGFMAALTPAAQTGHEPPLSWAELAPQLESRRRWSVHAPGLAMAALLLLVVGTAARARGVHADRAPLAHSRLVSAAWAAHQDPTVELRSEDPSALRLWIRQRTGVDLALAPAPGVKLEGAMRVAGAAVAVAFRVGERRVTFVVQRGGTGFAGTERSRQRDGDLLVWSHPGQTFASVATGRHDGTAACAACHAHGRML